jgi:hypothetical protein
MDSLRGGNKCADEILHEEDGILFRRLRLWIPLSLTDEVHISEHDSKIAMLMGQDRIKQLIRRNFWWPTIDEDIVKYIQACIECQRNEMVRYISSGYL